MPLVKLEKKIFSVYRTNDGGKHVNQIDGGNFQASKIKLKWKIRPLNNSDYIAADKETSKFLDELCIRATVSERKESPERSIQNISIRHAPVKNG